MTKIKHFIIGVAAAVVPFVPAVAASQAVQNFISAHPTYAVYYPIVSGLVVAAFHHVWPTYKKVTKVVPVAVAPAAPVAPVSPPPNPPKAA